jgi:hypothetical protein
METQIASYLVASTCLEGLGARLTRDLTLHISSHKPDATEAALWLHCFGITFSCTLRPLLVVIHRNWFVIVDVAAVPAVFLLNSSMNWVKYSQHRNKRAHSERTHHLLVSDCVELFAFIQSARNCLYAQRCCTRRS